MDEVNGNQQGANNNPQPTPSEPEQGSNQSTLPSNILVPKTPQAAGAKLTDTKGNATYTVTSADLTNPTVAFDGVTDENVEVVTIPDYVTIDGVKYQVTSVSIESFEQESTAGKYKVTDNTIDNLTVEYTGTTNKKKKAIIIPESVIYKGIKFKVTSVKAKALRKNTRLTSIKIADSITKIGNNAFEGCTNLKTVTLGKGLKTIDKNAFKNCKKLTKITVKSSKLKSVGKNALKGINAKCKIKVPKKKVKNYQKLFKGKGQKSTVKVTK